MMRLRAGDAQDHPVDETVAAELRLAARCLQRRAKDGKAQVDVAAWGRLLTRAADALESRLRRAA